MTALAAWKRLCAATLLAFLAGCAHAPTGGPSAPAAPRTPGATTPGGTPAATPAKLRPKPGYDGRVDSLDSVDGTRLRGRRIVLDPGHGGYFTGCLGVGGTTEAEVNLAVAQHLAELLRAQGAEVLLTRDRDRDFLTPADSTLRFDLSHRVAAANAFKPDLFLSIHHNADPGGAHDVNETQVYYQLGDNGPSYDVANDVLRSLARNVGIETVKLIPGNFYVVRGSDAPALLTETSYLTNPDVEARLKTDAARRIEAEALYLGIARYFMRPVPIIQPLGRYADDENGDFTLISRILGAYDDFRATIDGAPMTVRTTEGMLAISPAAPLAIGEHALRLEARLAGEGAARAWRESLTVVRGPQSRMRAEFVSPGAPIGLPLIDDSGVALRVRVDDAAGLPRPEPIAVRVRALAPVSLAPRETTIVCRDGVAWAYFHRTSDVGPHAPRTVGPVRVQCTIAEPYRGGAKPLLVNGTMRLDSRTSQRSDFALEMPRGERLSDAPGTAGAAPLVTALSRDGYMTISTLTPKEHAPRLAGFRAWGADTAFPPRYVAIAAGALTHKRIVLDPEGGGDDAAGIGRTGTRAATLNLEVAHALAGMLRAAGAEVRLTREGDVPVSEVERVQIAEGFAADRYLRIGHAAAPPMIGHYFSSSAGKRWGERLAAQARALGLDSVVVRDAAKYPLTQASSVALYASLARIDSAASEQRLLTPGALRAEAYALYLSLAREFGAEGEWPIERLTVRDRDGKPLAGTPVTLGGTLVLTSDAAGEIRFVRTEPGPLEAVMADPRAAEPRVLLDFSTRRATRDAR